MGQVIDQRRDGVCELKFPVPPATVERALAWIRSEWTPDPHGSGDTGDTYLVKSLYLDTGAFDVFHRRASFGRAKFRIRRYGDCTDLFLERKLKRDGVVRKRRVSVDPAEVARLDQVANGVVWPGSWFHHRLSLRSLRPVVMMNYRRVARLGRDDTGPIRVTFDRELRAVAADRFEVPRLIDGPDLLGHGAVLEIKFQRDLPAAARRFVQDAGLVEAGCSKFRLGLRACGLVQDEDSVDGGAGI